MDLLAVLRLMNQVGQEQAWGIAYELAALMQRLWPAGNCALIENLAQIYIHRDGFIHEKSLVMPLNKTEIELQLRDTSKQQQQNGTSRNNNLASTTNTTQEPQLEIETTITITIFKREQQVTSSPPRPGSTQQKHPPDLPQIE